MELIFKNILKNTQKLFHLLFKIIRWIIITFFDISNRKNIKDAACYNRTDILCNYRISPVKKIFIYVKHIYFFIHWYYHIFLYKERLFPLPPKQEEENQRSVTNRPIRTHYRNCAGIGQFENFSTDQFQFQLKPELLKPTLLNVSFKVA